MRGGGQNLRFLANKSLYLELLLAFARLVSISSNFLYNKPWQHKSVLTKAGCMKKD